MTTRPTEESTFGQQHNEYEHEVQFHAECECGFSMDSSLKDQVAADALTNAQTVVNMKHYMYSKKNLSEACGLTPKITILDQESL